MIIRNVRCFIIPVLVLASLSGAEAQEEGNTRIKDLVVINGNMPVQLVGYGLVVGLDQTGDRARGQRGSPYTVQSIANMLRNFGVHVDPALLTARNTAAVMVTTTMEPFSQAGTSIDATVSSLGDARSLSGGILLQTPLLDPQSNHVHAMAQGPVSTGAVLASARGSSVRVNHSNTGRVPNGAVVSRPSDQQFNPQGPLQLALRRPDFGNAVRISAAINGRYAGAAEVQHAGMLNVNIPGGPAEVAAFMAALEDLRIEVEAPARVVINERTGTIVAGGNVRISEVMVTYGSIVVSTQVDPFVSQPAPFGQGETVPGAVGTAEVKEEIARSVVLPPNTNVGQLAAALNELGLLARDVIAIFQAVDRAGALQGELVIL